MPRKLRAAILDPFLLKRCDLGRCERRAVILYGHTHLCEWHANLFSIGHLRAEAEREEREEHQRANDQLLDALDDTTADIAKGEPA